MRRALDLAKLGEGRVAPNPMVGAVVVHEGAIIGEGYHEKYGEAHAEVNAIESVENESLLTESTIFVSLEPCAHYGKTPPCADLIVAKKLKRVVIGCSDTFSEVDGNGIKRLKNAGIEVETFVLEEEARSVNKKFFTYHEKQRPYVLLKWAESQDGFIDSSTGNKDDITWISRPEVQPLVHQLRAKNQAILVGKNTVLNDNPALTVRTAAGQNPLRVILDTHCELPEDRTIFTDQNPTLVLNELKSEKKGSVEYYKIDKMTPEHILRALYNLNIQSVLIEGGSKTLQSFLDAGLWDEAFRIVGQSNLKSGTRAPEILEKPISENVVFGDQIKIYRL